MILGVRAGEETPHNVDLMLESQVKISNHVNHGITYKWMHFSKLLSLLFNLQITNSFLQLSDRASLHHWFLFLSDTMNDIQPHFKSQKRLNFVKLGINVRRNYATIELISIIPKPEPAPAMLGAHSSHQVNSSQGNHPFKVVNPFFSD